MITQFIIRVFNSTSRKAAPLDKQYMESMVPQESSGMARKDVQASTRLFFPPPADDKRERGRPRETNRRQRPTVCVVMNNS